MVVAGHEIFMNLDTYCGSIVLHWIYAEDDGSTYYRGHDLKYSHVKKKVPSLNFMVLHIRV